MCLSSFSGRVRLVCRTMLREIMPRASRRSFRVVIQLEVLQTRNNLGKSSLKEFVRLIGVSRGRNDRNNSVNLEFAQSDIPPSLMIVSPLTDFRFKKCAWARGHPRADGARATPPTR